MPHKQWRIPQEEAKLPGQLLQAPLPGEELWASIQSKEGLPCGGPGVGENTSWKLEVPLDVVIKCIDRAVEQLRPILDIQSCLRSVA